MPHRLAIAALGCLLSLSSLIGCSSSTAPKEDETTKDLGYIGRAYGVIISQGGKPPRDLAKIEQILEELHAADLNPSPEEVLNSSRDGKPYVIILEADVGATVSDEILAYEQTGVDGKRYVLTMSQVVKVMTDEEFSRATFAKGHKPAKS